MHVIGIQIRPVLATVESMEVYWVIYFTTAQITESLWGSVSLRNNEKQFLKHQGLLILFSSLPEMVTSLIDMNAVTQRVMSSTCYSFGLINPAWVRYSLQTNQLGQEQG